MPLTDRQIKALKPIDRLYKKYDGKGLYLEIHKNGAKYWRLKYRYLGKEKTFSIGVYPEISLAIARTKRDEARILLVEGIDPSANKKANKQAAKSALTNNFQTVAMDWYKIKQADKTEGHKTRVLKRIEQDLIPRLGKRPISEITAPELLQSLRDIEARGAIETAHRVKQIAGQIFRFAIASGLAERDPSADLKGALKAPPKKHFSAITEPSMVGQLMLNIYDYSGTKTVQAALKLSALFFCRPVELRHLKWSDIKEAESIIEIQPAKKAPTLVIPLSTQAKYILNDLKAHQTVSSVYIFPSPRGGSRCISENTIRVALRTMGYSNEEMTAHGFRAMARTILDEELNFPIEWIEQQLAHAVRDPNGRAYNRTKHLKQRANMMQVWADYLDQLRQAS